MLHIRLFGFPTFTLKDQPLGAITASPTLTNLFAFLVFQRGRPHARAWLAALLWPDLPETRARRNLNNALWELRLSINGSLSSGAALLVSDHQTIQFEAAMPLWLDTDEFSKVVASTHHALPTTQDQSNLAHRLEQAIDLYRGEFLEGLYAEWCIAPRERFRENYLTLLETLLKHYRAREQAGAALRIAQRLGQVEPLSEEAHFQRVELAIQLNRLPEARAYYQEYQSTWQRELGMEPSARMRALLYRIESLKAADIAPPTRESQLLQQALTLLKNSPTPVLEDAHAQVQREQM